MTQTRLEKLSKEIVNAENALDRIRYHMAKLESELAAASSDKPQCAPEDASTEHG